MGSLRSIIPAGPYLENFTHLKMYPSHHQHLVIVGIILFGLVLFGNTYLSYAQQSDRPVVAAASSLSYVLPRIHKAFSAKTGHQLRLSFGSSGNINRQIVQGAPYQIFLSADEKFVDMIVERSLTMGKGVVYALGSIVLYTGRLSPVKADANMLDLKASIDDGRLQRFSIANPVHAPYGRAAREALERIGLWKILEGKSVIGESVAQAARFTTTGSVQAGIISYSLLTAIPSSRRGTYAVIPKDWYRPIKQKMVLLSSAGEIAKAFYTFMLGEDAQRLLAIHGFTSMKQSK
ncbi:molybdate ABC transporter substrate-binding protein [Pseudomonadota bacterium]